MKILVALTALIALCPAAASAGVMVTYQGQGSSAGLNATANFELVSSNQLQITLSNTSVAPFGGSADSSDMVLSSLNFNLGAGVSITGGSVKLADGSQLVTKKAEKENKKNPSSKPEFDLNNEYGFSNQGVGNDALAGRLLHNTTAAQIGSMTSSVTSHSNGGQKVKPFSGGSGLPGGLDYGLVAKGSDLPGGKTFVQSSVVIDLTLDTALDDLGFLGAGSYVEFGSDYAFVGSTVSDPPEGDPSVTPEPGSLAIWLLMSAGLVGRRRMRNQIAS
ncbi:hypothetical protein NHH03_02425 [Stieleria sp. TO1_6]|uniref:XDD4 family exosortase-dependent surface protein n=1 Tax=Stieleria tagensis TaxID=2956795 RepID=UPI00209BB3EC|nr:XDD4 family exosortase-dependent surface protein [Stieleria tagensis]MCO8120579.1 hypothetical protein [Stieleria tagensis]